MVDFNKNISEIKSEGLEIIPGKNLLNDKFQLIKYGVINMGTIIKEALSLLFNSLPKDLVIKFVGKMLTDLENEIIASPNKIDDVALPVIKWLKSQLGITDNTNTNQTTGN